MPKYIGYGKDRKSKAKPKVKPKTKPKKKS